MGDGALSKTRVFIGRERARRAVVAALTARLMVTDCVKLPDVPVIMIEDDPVVTSLAATNTSLLALVVLLGSNDAVTPVGRRDARSVTLPLNSPEG